jgi:hypothetical protein
LESSLNPPPWEGGPFTCLANNRLLILPPNQVSVSSTVKIPPNFKWAQSHLEQRLYLPVCFAAKWGHVTALWAWDPSRSDVHRLFPSLSSLKDSTAVPPLPWGIDSKTLPWYQNSQMCTSLV